MSDAPGVEEREMSSGQMAAILLFSSVNGV